MNQKPGRPRIRVVAGILHDRIGRVLISRRQPGKHGAGLWEFPGGKIAAGEAPMEALVRELAEEIGVRVGEAVHLLSLEHDYPERAVSLDFRLVTAWQGPARPLEAQELAWVRPDALEDFAMLEADRPVVDALRSLNRR